MISVLSVLNVSKTFGGLRAISHVSLEVEAAKILSVIGPNGAGKTTLFNCLTGIYCPEEGAIVLKQESIFGLQPHQICRKGLARTFQNIRLFGEMSALENILVAMIHERKPNPWEILLRTPGYFQAERKCRETALQLLSLVGLEGTEDVWARNLAYGLQRRLEIARALATQPKVLLLDEPGAGMNPTEIAEISQLIGKLRNMGLAILLIEHHMKVVMDISDRIVVLDHGEKIAEGTPEQIRTHPDVIEAYLGKEV